jgi:NADH-quinone oxidoreductase subunit J
LGILVAALITIEMLAVLGAAHFGLDIVPAPDPQPDDYSNTRAIGLVLYTTYVYPFEIAAVILTVAIVAAITLTLRENKSRKSQVVSDQIKVRAEDRLRIVKMDAVRKETEL